MSYYKQSRKKRIAAAVIVVVLVGCMLFIAFVTNPLLVFWGIRKNPYPLVLRCLKDSGITAFFTRSSAANIPVNMELCRKLGLELVSTPVGFKWIYGEMEKGGVMIGGEESGGIGLPDHVKERDGLLMALLLTECMAQSGKDLGTIIDEMLADIGRLEFARRGLSVTDDQMARFRAETVPTYTADEIAGKRVLDVDRRDGVKLLLEATPG